MFQRHFVSAHLMSAIKPPSSVISFPLTLCLYCALIKVRIFVFECFFNFIQNRAIKLKLQLFILSFLLINFEKSFVIKMSFLS